MERVIAIALLVVAVSCGDEVKHKIVACMCQATCDGVVSEEGHDGCVPQAGLDEATEKIETECDEKQAECGVHECTCDCTMLIADC